MVVILYCLIVDFVFKIIYGVYLYMVEVLLYFVVMNKKILIVLLIIFFLLSKYVLYVFVDLCLIEYGFFRVKLLGVF